MSLFCRTFETTKVICRLDRNFRCKNFATKRVTLNSTVYQNEFLKKRSPKNILSGEKKELERCSVSPSRIFFIYSRINSSSSTVRSFSKKYKRGFSNKKFSFFDTDSMLLEKSEGQSKHKEEKYKKITEEEEMLLSYFDDEVKVDDVAFGFKGSMTGRVIGSVGDIVYVQGLESGGIASEVQFSNGSRGVVLNINQKNIMSIALLDADRAVIGDNAQLIGKELKFPVGPGIVGRILNAIGEPLDDKGDLKNTFGMPVLSTKPPAIIHRAPFLKSKIIKTGIKAIDLFHPITTGIRTSLLGPRLTGKTSIALDIICNQKKYNRFRPLAEKIFCVYVICGQTRTTTERIIDTLRSEGAMEYTSVICADRGTTLGLQYLAPFSGSVIGEYFRDNGLNALVVYDDLASHGHAYNELNILQAKSSHSPTTVQYSLSYVHARIIERSALVSEGKGLGSSSALCLVDSFDNDTNTLPFRISENIRGIADDFIVFERKLIDEGIWPPIESKSIVDSPTPRICPILIRDAVKKISQKMFTFYEHRERWEIMQNLGIKEEEEIIDTYDCGEVFQSFLRSSRSMEIDEMLVLLNGLECFLDYQISVDALPEFEDKLLVHFKTNHAQLMKKLTSLTYAPWEPLSKDIENLIKNAVKDFTLEFQG